MVSFLPAVAAYAFVGVCFGVACAVSNKPCDKGGALMLGLLWPGVLLVMVFKTLIDD